MSAGVDVAAVLQDDLLLVFGAREVVEAGEKVIASSAPRTNFEAGVVPQEEILTSFSAMIRVDIVVARCGESPALAMMTSGSA